MRLFIESIELTEIKEQLKQILQLAWITMVTQFMIILPTISSLMIAGHLNKESLAATGMGITVLNVMAFVVIIGLSTASEILFAQTNGSSNRSSMGITVQKSLLIKTLATFLLSSILVHTNSILLLFGQTEEISQMTHEFILACIPGMFGFTVLMVEIKYLQAQKIVKPCLITGLLANALHVSYNLAFVYGLQIGIRGCGIALSLTFWSWSLLLFAYIKISKIYKDTWSGIHFDCLRNWSSFLKYGLPGMLMLQIEMICFEIYAILSGLLGPVQLAIHIIANEVVNVFFNAVFGITTAATVQIANHLGDGDARKAKIATLLTIILAVVIPVLNSFILLSFHSVIPFIFSNDQNVISLAKPLLLIVCLEVIFDGMMVIEGGILRALGKHFYGAVINVCFLGILSIPMAIYLMFWTSLHVMGAWITLSCSTCIIATCFFIKIYFTDWEEEIKRAQFNAGVQDATGENKENTLLIDQSNNNFSKPTIVILRSIQATICVSIFIVSSVFSYF
ncbi:hypothetical protein SNE40_004327 [Patella caerulea]|uniref:Multidrug and toxin extrusion protein n=1 Tax=Patella caerulea TaxID=87958 RepID=A0AAN8Q5A5_PATCE